MSSLLWTKIRRQPLVLVVRNRQYSKKATLVAQLQVVASIPRQPCACLHIVTQAVSEESGRAVIGATKTDSVAGTFDGTCVVVKGNALYKMIFQHRSVDTLVTCRGERTQLAHGCSFLNKTHDFRRVYRRWRRLME